MQGNIALRSWIIYKEDGQKSEPLSGFDVDLMYQQGELNE